MTTTIAAPKNVRGYAPTGHRPNAVQDAEIYRRVFVLEEITQAEAAAWYGISASPISEILTEEHGRRHHARRSRVPRQRPNQESDLEIYNRVVVRRELTPAQAARENGISRQRVAQLLDKQHLQLDGVRRSYREDC